MEQIYYTQCPVGYGLGASNGFQIKRMTPGYPVSGDFRHLGMKAFPGGGRSLAPPALRYRRDGDVVEVAWLTPRAHEYETERGLWGRPGGLFAHGVRLAASDLAAIRSWPAGLWDAPAWRRSDPEPSRGQPPSEFDLAEGALSIRPEFGSVARLAGGEGPERLARLLAGVAIAAREGRTLFLVADPGRLGPMVALLTFAFPEAMRGALTFSTFHDRPEELPGFRIQGTSPIARPNRPALASLGIVADLDAGTCEPPIDPPRWARTLAGWFIHPGPVAEADWSTADDLARRADRPDDAWSDDWLDHLIGFPEACRDRGVPESAEGWARLRSFAEWSARAGAGGEWIRGRGPSWWSAVDEKDRPEARAALLAHLGLREAWADAAEARGWGEAFAGWFGGIEAGERDGAIADTLRAAPREARPAFARALIGGLAPDAAGAVLRRLRSDPSCDRGMLIPLEAGAAAARVRDGGDPSPLRSLVEAARGRSGVLAAVLDAAAGAVADRPEAVALLARAVAPAFDPDAPGQGRAGMAWALGRGADAPGWIGPALRPFLSDADRAGDWRALRDRTPEADRPALARAWLALASDPGLPDDAFRWGVEEMLLPMSPRPADPAWAETYLARMPSGLDLIRRLITPEFRKRGVPDWIAEARGRGEVSDEQARRVDDALDFGRLLRSGDPAGLLGLRLPGVPPEERGALLLALQGRLRDAAGAGLGPILDAVREAWPGGFDAGAPGLGPIGDALSRPLDPLRARPDDWLGRAGAIVARLRPPDAGDGWGWEPDGVVAEMVAASSARLPIDGRWPVRQRMLRDDRAWRALAADARGELRRAGAADAAPGVVAAWDRALVQPRPERFFELMLNACDGPRLARVVAARVADLRSLPPLPWWSHADYPEARDDIRDGFARTAPLAPLPGEALPALKAWVGDGLSAFGSMRWKCLETLSGFARSGYDAATRGQIVRGWTQDRGLNEALAAVPDPDRHRFAARVILGLDDDAIAVEPLARWLERAGVRDLDRLGRWAEELDGLAEVGDADRIGRMRLVGDLKRELATLLREARESARPRDRPPREP
ncbi:hypothetical protein TA3x_003897 [Tundrisphaera sp. TA3]|uniref:GAP1-M domain-containing protein n=1 Tax=Tundrisphaera sp. TA3 TaxID=3435775 RepID=UPI003EBC78B7